MSSESNLFPRALSLAVHELRTPITVATGYLRMLLREQAGPITDQQKKMLQEADKSCARIGSIVAEMSELGKLEEGQITVPRVAFDLSALIEEGAGGLHGGQARRARPAPAVIGGLVSGGWRAVCMRVKTVEPASGRAFQGLSRWQAIVRGWRLR